jgi:hypothetical protein
MGPSTLKTVDQGANEEGLILRDKPAAVDLKANRVRMWSQKAASIYGCV